MVRHKQSGESKIQKNESGGVKEGGAGPAKKDAEERSTSNYKGKERYG